jgi:hypothetical protein
MWCFIAKPSPQKVRHCPPGFDRASYGMGAVLHARSNLCLAPVLRPERVLSEPAKEHQYRRWSQPLIETQVSPVVFRRGHAPKILSRKALNNQNERAPTTISSKQEDDGMVRHISLSRHLLTPQAPQPMRLPHSRTMRPILVELGQRDPCYACGQLP